MMATTNKKIDILGTEYKILCQTSKENKKLKNANGICECYSKEIVLDDIESDDETWNDFDKYKDKVLRHEIIHAYFHESGLREYCDDEKLVDFLALQFHKIEKTFSELGI